MRLLVHSGSLAAAPRMLHAAWGLAGRGHEVCWLGPARPAGATEGDVSLVAGACTVGRADVLIGGATGLLAAAWAGGLTGAHSAVLDATVSARWGFVEQVVWGMLDGIRFAEAGSGEAAPVDPADSDTERAREWSAAPLPACPDPGHPDVECLERACERLVARRITRGLRPAVFLDRDGTLVIEREYLSQPDEIELLPGVAAALRTLHAAGYALVVVSNQSGVGRGLFPLSRVHAAMRRLRRELRRHGVELDAVYFCPHRPEDGCPCRKPSPELLRRAAANLGLSLRESAMVGDKALDVETGRRAGARGVLVRTGYGREEESHPGAAVPAPDHVADDLEAAVPWLLEQHPRLHTV